MIQFPTAVSLATLYTVTTTLAIAPLSFAAPQSWLDQPLRNWNPNLPILDIPPRGNPDPSELNRCRSTLRSPQSMADRLIQQRGWYLVGTPIRHQNVEIILGNSRFDGMCRPMGYQAFVFSGGRYLGTLSPNLMDSRADGSFLGEVKFQNDGTFTADFARYTPNDPLCCPSRISTVTYRLAGGLLPLPRLVPVAVSTQATANNPPSQPPELSLSGQRWRLRRIGNQAVPVDTAFIEFDSANRRANGFTGCNSFNGGYTANGPRLLFAPLATTQRLCGQEPLQSVETQMLQGLSRTNRYRVQGNTLQLFEGNRLLLTFEAGATESPLSGRWQLQRLANMPMPPRNPMNTAFIEFDSNAQRATGFSGCNNFNGGYSVNGQQLRFSAVATTRRACIGQRAQRMEMSFLQTLEQTNRYRIEGNTLTFYDGDRPLAMFQRTP
ncbi:MULTISPECIES: META domain-containing protein [unclassified Thermosynechococcus]|uniref:META domain-containing protein n=1 Tax=unclassified Thermosynechococcus TaxID=2622553 RepID=UPI0026741DB2|nr:MULTISPECIES: META domain-containing protein [unclassified Thermosynechococcus]WKT83444.1 META domain-containing protein [Thermosynechococcus sp. HY596]WNC62575.1 META domain-containing protein [Thermosynechococcus sp. HY591]WNC65132.1 META domain-containing protein [Thermosynechococcus sp. HY593]